MRRLKNAPGRGNGSIIIVLLISAITSGLQEGGISRAGGQGEIWDEAKGAAAAPAGSWGTDLCVAFRKPL